MGGDSQKHGVGLFERLVGGAPHFGKCDALLNITEKDESQPEKSVVEMAYFGVKFIFARRQYISLEVILDKVSKFDQCLILIRAIRYNRNLMPLLHT